MTNPNHFEACHCNCLAHKMELSIEQVCKLAIWFGCFDMQEFSGVYVMDKILDALRLADD